MADAGKDLRKIKQFTKRHADFLFGLNLNNFKHFNIKLDASSQLKYHYQAIH